VKIERLPAMQIVEQASDAVASGTAMIPVYGSPTLVMPEHVQAAVADAARRVHERVTRGWLSLRQTIAENLRDTYGVTADPERELLVTHGAMHGLSVTFRGLFELGDEVIVPAPTFFYDEAIRMSGATPVYVDLLESDDWHWDLGRLEGTVTSRTRGVVVCNPNNPTATVPSRDEVRALVDWAATRGLIVVADEAYARFVFDGGVFTPQMTFRDAHPDLVTVTSLSKNYGFSNWRVGYVHAADPLLAKIHRVFEWDALDVGPVPQAAAQAVIAGPQSWIEAVLATYQPNRDRLMAGLAGTGLRAVRPAGGPFAFVDFADLGLSGRALEAALMARGIAAVAGDGFQGPDSYARIMFGGTTEALDAVIGVLHRLVDEAGRAGAPTRGD